ncbi:hypothetical protein EYF80_059945 [Liparis tanakae]|uniref:G-protein coupled receptors family 1 profile domain-containing protein n=1 Tax=Liparis tanakae TaxID=230148 RepID=A0A4Z2EN48_9TELE|nr:hypothetical protein EYF80_059945 [Liparis tanakae]
MVRWRRLKEQVRLLVQLALADLLAALVLMASSAMDKVSTDHRGAVCQYSLPLSLTFNFISFLLVVVYAWKSKNAIQGWRARPTEQEGVQSRCRRKIVGIRLYAIVWSIPITMYLAYVFTPFIRSILLIPVTHRSVIACNDTTYCSSCILFLHVWRDSSSDAERMHDTFIRGFLVVIVIAVMLSCSVIYYTVGKWYKGHEQEGLFPVEGDGRSRRRFKRVFSIARNMVIVILFCWAPALVLILLSALTSWTQIERHSLFGLYMIQAASVSLQGFLNSVVYAWGRPNFTDAVLGEHTPLVAHQRLAFFEESLVARVDCGVYTG